MRMVRLVPGLVLVVLCACGGGSGTPGATPRAVDPSTGLAGVATAVRITGDDFLARPDGSQLDTRQRAWLDDVELADVTWVDVHTLTATVPASLTPGAKTLRVQNAYGGQGTLANAFTVVDVSSRLAASLTVNHLTVGLGQPVDVTFTVRNGGSGAADLTSVTTSQTGAAAACGTPSPAPPVRVAAGGSQAFTWQCTGSSPGNVTLEATAAGTDASSGAPLSVSAAAGQVAVQAPAALAATLSVDGSPSAVAVGQAFTLRLAASDTGGASAFVNSLTVTPLEAGCGTPTPALPQTMAGGQGATFTFSCAATTAGGLAPAVSIRGQDGNSGGLLTAMATLTPALTVQPPATLTATIAATPTTLAVGQTIAVTFTVTNPASAPRVTVNGMGSWSTGTGAATCTSVSVPAHTMINPGAAQSFGWSCTATGAGALLLGGTLTYTPSGGAMLSASPAVPLAVTVTP